MTLGQVIAGAGGGGLLSISAFLGSDLVPLRQQGVAQGNRSLRSASGAMLGCIAVASALNDQPRPSRLEDGVLSSKQVQSLSLCAVAVYFLVKVSPKALLPPFPQTH